MLTDFYSFYIILIVKKFYMRYSKIYHITLIVRAPYFAYLNNNSFRLKMLLLFFVHLRSQQKRTEKVISSYQT